jgi:hypothetical protein
MFVVLQAMQLIGAKNLRDYIVDKQTGTGGFGSGWKIYSAHARKDGGFLVSLYFKHLSFRFCEILIAIDIS